jgi:hypothetical protein
MYAWPFINIMTLPTFAHAPLSLVFRCTLFRDTAPLVCIILPSFLALSYIASPSASAMPSTEQAALKATIVNTCTEHQNAHWRDRDYRASVFIEGKYVVKFDNPKTLRPEIEAHYNYAQSHADAPRILKIIFHFEDQRAMYIVMEYITLVKPPLNLP